MRKKKTTRKRKHKYRYSLYVEAAGVVGAVLSAMCALPQVFKVVSQGHAVGLSLFFIGAYFISRCCTTAYCILKYGPDWLFIWGGILTLTFNGILIYYILFLTP